MFQKEINNLINLYVDIFQKTNYNNSKLSYDLHTHYYNCDNSFNKYFEIALKKCNLDMSKLLQYASDEYCEYEYEEEQVEEEE